MRAKLLLKYEIASVNALPAGDIQLFSRGQTRVRLTMDQDAEDLHFIRHRACGRLALNVLVGGTPGDEPSDKLANAMKQVKEERARQRPQQTSKSAILIVEVEKDIGEISLRARQDFDDCSLCLDAISDSGLERDALNVTSIAVSGLAIVLGFERLPNFRRLDRSFILLEDNSDKPIFVIKLTGSANMYTTGPLEMTAAEQSVKFIGRLDAPQFASIARLLSEALDEASNNLRAFISAWTALEIFVAKVFTDYERAHLDKLRSTGSLTIGKFVARIEDVMRDKYRLTDKFTAIASAIGGDKSEDDVREFKDLKRTRDDFFHGDREVDELPTHKVIALLVKYLRFHIEEFSTSN
jgi:hypothetical protein